MAWNEHPVVYTASRIDVGCYDSSTPSKLAAHRVQVRHREAISRKDRSPFAAVQETLRQAHSDMAAARRDCHFDVSTIDSLKDLSLTANAETQQMLTKTHRSSFSIRVQNASSHESLIKINACSAGRARTIGQGRYYPSHYA